MLNRVAFSAAVVIALLGTWTALSTPSSALQVMEVSTGPFPLAATTQFNSTSIADLIDGLSATEGLDILVQIAIKLRQILLKPGTPLDFLTASGVDQNKLIMFALGPAISVGLCFVFALICALIGPCICCCCICRKPKQDPEKLPFTQKVGPFLLIVFSLCLLSASITLGFLANDLLVQTIVDLKDSSLSVLDATSDKLNEANETIVDILGGAPAAINNALANIEQVPIQGFVNTLVYNGTLIASSLVVLDQNLLHIVGNATNVVQDTSDVTSTVNNLRNSLNNVFIPNLTALNGQFNVPGAPGYKYRLRSAFQIDTAPLSTDVNQISAPAIDVSSIQSAISTVNGVRAVNLTNLANVTVNALSAVNSTLSGLLSNTTVTEETSVNGQFTSIGGTIQGMISTSLSPLLTSIDTARSQINDIALLALEYNTYRATVIIFFFCVAAAVVVISVIVMILRIPALLRATSGLSICAMVFFWLVTGVFLLLAFIIGFTCDVAFDEKLAPLESATLPSNINTLVPLAAGAFTLISTCSSGTGNIVTFVNNANLGFQVPSLTNLINGTLANANFNSALSAISVPSSVTDQLALPPSVVTSLNGFNPSNYDVSFLSTLPSIASNLNNTIRTQLRSGLVTFRDNLDPQIMIEVYDPNIVSWRTPTGPEQTVLGTDFQSQMDRSISLLDSITLNGVNNVSTVTTQLTTDVNAFMGSANVTVTGANQLIATMSGTNGTIQNFLSSTVTFLQTVTIPNIVGGILQFANASDSSILTLGQCQDLGQALTATQTAICTRTLNGFDAAYFTFGAISFFLFLACIGLGLGGKRFGSLQTSAKKQKKAKKGGILRSTRT